jgi:hypothetical protein
MIATKYPYLIHFLSDFHVFRLILTGNAPGTRARTQARTRTRTQTWTQTRAQAQAWVPVPGYGYRYRYGNSSLPAEMATALTAGSAMAALLQNGSSLLEGMAAAACL